MSGNPPEIPVVQPEDLPPQSLAPRGQPQQPTWVDKLLESRRTVRALVSEHGTVERVSAVLDALFRRACGVPPVVGRGADGREVLLQKGLPPNVQAARLYLAYIAGEPESFNPGDSPTKPTEVSVEDARRLMEIARKYGHGLRLVRVVDTTTTAPGGGGREAPRGQEKYDHV